MGLIFQSVPVGALQSLPADERLEYLETIYSLPKSVLELISSPRTGAYVQGVAKTYNLPLEVSPQISLAILKIAVGKSPLAQLGALLSSELKIANDVAQKMAAELEHDLFAPVAVELSAYLEAKKRGRAASAAATASQAGASNVLNLKDGEKRPTPPPLPRPSRPPTPPPIPRNFTNPRPQRPTNPQ